MRTGLKPLRFAIASRNNGSITFCCNPNKAWKSLGVSEAKNCAEAKKLILESALKQATEFFMEVSHSAKVALHKLMNLLQITWWSWEIDSTFKSSGERSKPPHCSMTSMITAELSDSSTFTFRAAIVMDLEKRDCRETFAAFTLATISFPWFWFKTTRMPGSEDFCSTNCSKMSKVSSPFKSDEANRDRSWMLSTSSSGKVADVSSVVAFRIFSVTSRKVARVCWKSSFEVINFGQQNFNHGDHVLLLPTELPDVFHCCSKVAISKVLAESECVARNFAKCQYLICLIFSIVSQSHSLVWSQSFTDHKSDLESSFYQKTDLSTVSNPIIWHSWLDMI